MTKDEYIKMLYQRTEYLKSEIADFEQCNGEVEQARLWAIKEQVSRIFGLIDVCDKELFPDTIRCEKTAQEYLQTCNTEQLAEFLSRVLWARTFCEICDINKICKISNKCKYGNKPYKECWKKWLKQPHRGDGE